MAIPRKSKYPYTVKEDRIIYIIHAPHSNNFFIWHCKKDLWKSSYQRHLSGKRKPTADFINHCKEQGYQPCFHILEEVHLTQVMAYKHVIAWTQILELNGYDTLADIKTLFYMSEMFEYTETVFQRNRNADLKELLSCENCLIKDCPSKKQLI